MSKRFEIARFAFVGLISNAILYVAYLLLTYQGVGHKTAVSVLFAVGVTQTFFLNRRWTFGHSGRPQRAYVRYWIAYGIAFVVNLSLLGILVDWLGYRHQVVQGLLVLAIAGILFFVQKFWVFREVTHPAADELRGARRQ